MDDLSENITKSSYESFVINPHGKPLVTHIDCNAKDLTTRLIENIEHTLSMELYGAWLAGAILGR